eukprot:1699385-Amphidinium_carterae.1
MRVHVWIWIRRPQLATNSGTSLSVKEAREQVYMNPSRSLIRGRSKPVAVHRPMSASRAQSARSQSKFHVLIFNSGVGTVVTTAETKASCSSEVSRR